jgi:HK97 family phage major capsid protein
MANPQDRKLQEAAKFEYEVSEAAAKKAGKSSRGIYIPNEVLRHSRRDLVVGTASAGGNLVATDLLGGSFIELLRNKLVLADAGMTVLSGLQGNVAIPKQTGGATAYMVAENAAPTESAPTFGQVTMSPKTLAAYVDFSRKLIVQSNMDIEAMVRGDLIKVAGLKIDYLGLYGSGSSNEPTGVKATAGINSVNFAAAAPTYAEIVQMESLISADNADVASMAYLVNAAGRGVLKGVDKASGAAQFVWEPGNTVNGYKALVSNQVATPSDPDYWLGNWSDLVLGLWGGLDLMADPYTGSKEGTVRVTIFQELDFGVRHAESFCYGNNAAL